MKVIKLYLSIVCYLGFGSIFINQDVEDIVLEGLKISDPLKEIILWLFIVFWIIKSVWFIIDKILQYQERKQKMHEIKHKHDDNE